MVPMTREELAKEIIAVNRVMDNGTDKALGEILRALYAKGFRDGHAKVMKEMARGVNRQAGGHNGD